MFAAARCRWLLTLEPAASAPTELTAAAALAELRLHTQDDTLQCALTGPGSRVLALEGSWQGYLLATKAVHKLQLRTLCGHTLTAIEPMFTPQYLLLYQNQYTQRTIIENFVQVYGPLFLMAVKHARSKYSHYWNVPSAEEILTAVWERCISKLATLIESYSADRGKQYGYLFTVAKHAAHDYIRPLVNDPEEPMESDELALPLLPERLHELLEKRELLQKLMATFKEHCDQHPERKKPGDWDFFREHFLNEVAKEDMCQSYGITSNTFDKRVHRIRDRLLAILNSWLAKEKRVR